MKRTSLLMLALAFLAAPLAAFANPTKISYGDAYGLFGALSKMQSGISSANVGFAAQNIWALKGAAEAFSKAQIQAANASRKAQSAKDAAEAQEKVQADWDAFRNTEITIDLQPLNLPLTDDEIKESKITPDVYAPILAFLSKKKS